MNYKEKDYIDGSAPDSFDSEQCPLFQRYVEEHKQMWIREQIKAIIENKDDNIYKTE